MNEKDIDPLDNIFVDKNEPVNKKILSEIIIPYAKIDKEGIIEFTEKFDELTDTKKTLIYMCCKKAMVLKEIPNVVEECGPKEISDKILISISSAKNVTNVRYKKLLKKESKGKIIPNYNLKKVKEEIFENVKKQ